MDIFFDIDDCLKTYHSKNCHNRNDIVFAGTQATQNITYLLVTGKI